MFDTLMDEIATLHREIQDLHPAPADAWERQAAEIFAGTQRVLLALIQEHVGLRTLELGLLYNWLRLATLNRGSDETHFSRLAENLSMIMKQLVTELKALEAELDDEGPTAAMTEIGTKIQQLRDGFGPIDDTHLPRHEIERHTAQTMRALFGFTAACLEQGDSTPGLLESAMLYHWLRAATVTANLPERFFQKLERHWPAVFRRVGQMTDRLLKGG